LFSHKRQDGLGIAVWRRAVHNWANCPVLFACRWWRVRQLCGVPQWRAPSPSRCSFLPSRNEYASAHRIHHLRRPIQLHKYIHHRPLVGAPSPWTEVRAQIVRQLKLAGMRSVGLQPTSAIGLNFSSRRCCNHPENPAWQSPPRHLLL